MSRALLTCWHKYTNFGGQYYEPMLDFYIAQMKEFEDEYDMIYLIDSTWNIDPKKIKGLKATIVKVNPSLRYYDAYKEVLPQVEEDLVFFLDNDSVIWKEGIINKVFALLEKDEPVFDHVVNVACVFDTIGTYQPNEAMSRYMNGKNKFCLYWFATKKTLLMKYLDIDWGPDMPYCETLGHLTEAMLNDTFQPYEWPETKDSIYFDGHKDGGKQEHEGYYSHIRAGSTPAVLLAWKNSPEHQQQYQDYLKEQPKNEYLRQIAWFYMMSLEGTTRETDDIGMAILSMLKDMEVSVEAWEEYIFKFMEYHGLAYFGN